MLSAYRNEIYRSKKWQPEDPETMTRKTKWTELWIVFSVRIQMESECRTYRMSTAERRRSGNSAG